MKICLAGGRADRAEVLAAALRARGHEVALLALPSWGALAAGDNARVAGLWRTFGGFDVVHVFDAVALRLIVSAFDGAFPAARVTHVREPASADAWAENALGAYARAAQDGLPRTSHWDRYGSQASYSEEQTARTYDARRFTTAGGLAFDAIEREEVDAAVGRGPLTVLDVGAGTARFASHLARAGHTVFASEVSGPMLEQARVRLAAEGTHGRVRVVQGDGYALPFRDGSFAAVTAIRVLNQIFADDDKAALVAEMFRVARPGGRVVFDIINATSLARLRQPAGLISVAGACGLVDAAGGVVTGLAGRLVLSETLLHVVPVPLVPLAVRLDRLMSRVLGGLATRVYVTALKEP